MGLGLIFQGLIRGAAYAPEVEDQLFGHAMLGFALVESFLVIAVGVMALVYVDKGFNLECSMPSIRHSNSLGSGLPPPPSLPGPSTPLSGRLPLSVDGPPYGWSPEIFLGPGGGNFPR